jgi:hypothetical protein
MAQAPQQPPIQQQLYPPPPPFYRLYRADADGTPGRPLPPLPPPAAAGEYQQFGVADSVSGGCFPAPCFLPAFMR